MDLLQVAKLINSKINAIEEQRKQLEGYALEKARTESEYDKAICITLIRLKAGNEMEIEGNKIQNPPVSIMEKLSKGFCWKSSLAKNTAEANYKATVSNINALESQLNGYQSINRYLKEVVTD